MGDTKHTPGPWHGGTETPSGVPVYAKNGRIVAVVRGPAKVEDFELMIAAPELLEALDRCEAALSAYLIECGPLMTPIDAEEICTAARAAIEKARGG